MPDLAGVLQQPPRVVGPVVEVGRARRGRPRPGSAGRRAGRADRRARRRCRSRRIHTRSTPSVSRRNAAAASRSSQPAAQREVAARTRRSPGSVIDEHDPAQLGGDAIGQLGERPGRQRRRPARGREAVGEHQAGHAACRARCGAGRGARRCSTPPDRGEQLLHGRSSSPRRSSRLAAAVALVGLVAAVAGLGERVGAEAEEGLGRHELLDDRRVVDVVDVVHDLACACRRPSGGARTWSGVPCRRSSDAREARRRSAARREREAHRSGLPCSDECWIRTEATLRPRGRDHVRTGRVPAASSAVAGWIRQVGPACRLAASHLRGPTTTVVHQCGPPPFLGPAQCSRHAGPVARIGSVFVERTVYGLRVRTGSARAVGRRSIGGDPGPMAPIASRYSSLASSTCTTCTSSTSMSGLGGLAEHVGEARRPRPPRAGRPPAGRRPCPTATPAVVEVLEVPLQDRADVVVAELRGRPRRAGGRR